MRIARNTVVTLEYRVTDPQGTVVDQGVDPIHYLHGGYAGIFAKIEEALDDKAVGDSVRVNLQPEDAFGIYDKELVSEEERDQFPPELEVGMQFELVNAEDGEETLYRVTGFDDDKVVLDGNHPLAGMPLVFHCTVRAIRPATAQEIRQRAVA